MRNENADFCMMRFLRQWQNYFLFTVIMFKPMVLGMLFTLATHSICMQHLVAEDNDLRTLIVKRHKRSDEPPFLTFDLSDAITGPLITSRAKTAVAALLRVIHQYFSPLLHTFTPRPFHFSWLDRERLFLQHCAILR